MRSGSIRRAVVVSRGLAMVAKEGRKRRISAWVASENSAKGISYSSMHSVASVVKPPEEFILTI
jgi:hypothetical protein